MTGQLFIYCGLNSLCAGDKKKKSKMFFQGRVHEVLHSSFQENER